MTRDARVSRLSRVLLALLSFVLPFGLALSTPLRPQGGDTVPAKIGMHILQCERSFDLAGADWLRRRVLDGKRPYYAVVTQDQRRLVSTWGPGPSVWGALTTRPLRPGMAVTDSKLAHRARTSAALAIALAGLFLFLALVDRTPPTIALLGSLTASLSFAGAGMLGQALWQQTVACVLFAASWWAWSRGTSPTSGQLSLPIGAVLSVVAGLVRPADAVLAIAGVAICVRPLLQSRRRTELTGATIGAIVAVAVFATWNLAQFGVPWPVGQAITHAGESGLFQTEVGDVGVSFTALFLSPSRGLLFFAPIVIVAIATGARASIDAKIMSALVLVQLVVDAAFYKWWGGVAFGPRLAAIPVWASCFILLRLVPPVSVPKRLLGVSAIVTIAVGFVGLYGYDPRKWDLRVGVDEKPAAVWSLEDSVIVASLCPLPAGSQQIVDSPPGPFRYCVKRTLRSD